jgi:hypothetical protein
MKEQTNTWSEGLQQETRDAISEMRINPDGKLHFKNCHKGYAYMSVQDLLSGKLSLTDKESGEAIEFASTEELLAAGWAVD